jgi:hypothetical protein
MDNVNGYPLVVIQLMLNGVAFGAEWRKELPCTIEKFVFFHGINQIILKIKFKT